MRVVFIFILMFLKLNAIIVFHTILLLFILLFAKFLC